MKEEPKPPIKVDPLPPSGSRSTAKKAGEREQRLQERPSGWKWSFATFNRSAQGQRSARAAGVDRTEEHLRGKGETRLALADLNKKTVEINSLEDVNIVKLATMYDALSPESAAQILKEMAEKGRMDTAARFW